MRYSVQGYLAAVKLRGHSGRTVLVEGETDKRVLGRVSEELGGRRPEKVYIDSADLIYVNPCMGNRDIVIDVHSKAVGQLLKIAAFVDREFNKFTFLSDIKDEQPIHNVEQTTLFWTRGHSIENYFFTCDRVSSFLRYRFSEKLPDRWESAIKANIVHVIQWAAACSLSASENRCLTRMIGLIQVRHWIMNGAQIVLDVRQFMSQLASRSIPDVTILAMESQATKNAVLLGKSPQLNLAQWVAHGHLGEEILWSGVSYLISTLGADPKLINEITSGYCEEKLRHAADGWAPQVVVNAPETPSALVDWLIASPCIMP